VQTRTALAVAHPFALTSFENMREQDDPMTPARLDITRRCLTHLGDSDRGEQSLLSSRVTYSVHGHSPLAGEFSGPEEITRNLTNLFERTLGTFETIQWRDWLEDEIVTEAVDDVLLGPVLHCDNRVAASSSGY
jgi:hypothetical protein